MVIWSFVLEIEVGGSTLVDTLKALIFGFDIWWNINNLRFCELWPWTYLRRDVRDLRLVVLINDATGRESRVMLRLEWVNEFEDDIFQSAMCRILGYADKDQG